MPALTKDQWYAKFRNWIPEGFFGVELNQRAVLMGLAQSMFDRQTEAEAHVTESTIEGGEGLTLDERGDERSIVRAASESDTTYRVRLRNLGSNSARKALQKLIDAILIEGTAEIIEHQYDTVYFDREDFFDRGQVYIGDLYYNTFSIIIPEQFREPESFLDREYYFDREAIFGTLDSVSAVIQAIVDAVQRNKLGGTLFRLIEL